VCPFQSTIREQGFLIYFPVHNEIMVNITSKSLVFGFFRPENLTSGVSLKSRTRNQPELGGLWSVPPQQDKNVSSGVPVRFNHWLFQTFSTKKSGPKQLNFTFLSVDGKVV
jgi:hypothetical protein